MTGHEVILVPEVVAWYGSLDDADAERVEAVIDYLSEHGPAAKRPVVGELTRSKIKKMKELRTGSIRLLFVFDPMSRAIILVAGDKSGTWNAWYSKNIPVAERRYERWLADPEAE